MLYKYKKKRGYMKKIKSMLDEMKDRAEILSNGEAIILLDLINKKEGFVSMLELFNRRMKHIKQQMIDGIFNLEGCKNINTQLALELIALTEKEHLTKTMQIIKTINDNNPTTKEKIRI